MARSYFFSIFNRIKTQFSANAQHEFLKDNFSTAIKSQVEVMESIKEEWWIPEGKTKVLHAYNELRIPFIKDGLFNAFGSRSDNPNLPLKNMKILDIGCGGGILSEAIAKLGAKVDGVDASNDLLEVARVHAALDENLKENLNYIHTSIEDHCESHIDAYDAVVVSEVIEHIENKDVFLEHCLKTLKPGGSVYFTTFSRTWFAWFYGIVVLEYILGIIPKGTHEYRLFISSDKLSDLLKKYNCETVEVSGLSYNFLRNKWSFIDSLRFCYALQAVKKSNTPNIIN